LRHASATPEQRRQLAVTTGETEALIGVMRLMDLYQFDAAWRHLDRALVAARETDAAELEAFVVGCMAFNACYGGDHGEAGQLSALARNLVMKVDAPVTAGWLAAVDAEIQARAGDESGCLAALDHAQASLAKPGKDPASWIGVGSFDTAKLAGYYGACYQLLGRPQEALAELQKALGALEPTMLKHRCNAMADVALAFSQLKRAGRELPARQRGAIGRGRTPPRRHHRPRSYGPTPIGAVAARRRLPRRCGRS
jgi:tetratricopeptide (TPR) repeat protein